MVCRSGILELFAMLCYIARKFPQTESASFKARTDMDAIMASQGFRNVGVRNNLRSNKYSTWFATFAGVLKAGLLLHRGDKLVVQYPDPHFKLICRMAKLRRAHVVTLIHDLVSFGCADIRPEEEIALLSKSDYIIALNQSMEGWLRTHGCTVPSTSLGIWDYLSSAAHEARQTASLEPQRRSMPEPSVSSDEKYTVMFAGGVSRRRNQFLYDWGTVIDGYKVVVFGNNFDLTQAAGASRFKLRGFVPSSMMIRHPDGDFGLVWDGNAINGCNGPWGEYLRYNNPHKASLYIRCGVPVIIWKHAGLASFVEEQGIGFTISSLADIAPRLRALSDEEYNRMKENVARVSLNVSSGYYFCEAMNRALESLGVHEKQFMKQFAVIKP